MWRSRPSEYWGATRCIFQSGKKSEMTIVTAAASNNNRDQRFSGLRKNRNSRRNRPETCCTISFLFLRGATAYRVAGRSLAGFPHDQISLHFLMQCRAEVGAVKGKHARLREFDV